jgi:hypothetical protein
VSFRVILGTTLSLAGKGFFKALYKFKLLTSRQQPPIARNGAHFNSAPERMSRNFQEFFGKKYNMLCINTFRNTIYRGL